jgi:hypothetical protein
MNVTVIIIMIISITIIIIIIIYSSSFLLPLGYTTSMSLSHLEGLIHGIASEIDLTFAEKRNLEDYLKDTAAVDFKVKLDKNNIESQESKIDVDDWAGAVEEVEGEEIQLEDRVDTSDQYDNIENYDLDEGEDAQLDESTVNRSYSGSLDSIASPIRRSRSTGLLRKLSVATNATQFHHGRRFVIQISL